MFARNLDNAAAPCLNPETLQQHRVQFAVEVFEKKVFLPTMAVRETHLACPQGQGDADRQKRCMHRGRQKQWYKDFWLSQWQRLWRWSPFQAAKTAHRSRSHLMRPHSSTSITARYSKNDHLTGWAFGPVQHPFVMQGSANG